MFRLLVFIIFLAIILYWKLASTETIYICQFFTSIHSTQYFGDFWYHSDSQKVLSKKPTVILQLSIIIYRASPNVVL